jgi:hypothetical protein
MAVDQNENRVRDNVRRAIEVMTAWTVDPDKQFTWSRFVLLGLEKATGNSAPWHLQQIAAKYA